MALLAEWNIQSPAPVCAATGKPFAEGDKVVSVLLQDRKGDLRRLDYAAEAWPQEKERQAELIDAGDGKNDGLEVLSSWRAAYKPRAAAAGPAVAEPLTKDNAEGLLRRLLAERNPAQANACYILAVMLERKRGLKELDRKEIDGKPYLVYEHAASGETWIVPNPPLRLDEMYRVQAEVMELLAGPAPAPAAEAAPVAQAEGAPVAETPAETEAEGHPGSSEEEEHRAEA